MRIEILIFIITGFFIMNSYYDNKYIDMVKSWKKYFQMAAIAFAGMSAYFVFKRYPEKNMSFIESLVDFINYLPVDKDSTDIFTSFVNKVPVGMTPQFKRMLQSGKNSTKRCVSETKKKHVASSQNWKCGNCNKMLPAWFEVDHKVRLDQGGTNEINNLVALCRDCHGEKTALENM